MLAVADLIDRHPVWTELRAAMRNNDLKARKRILEEIAASDKVASLSPARRVLLGEQIRWVSPDHELQDAIRVLRQAQQANPGDFWANARLAEAFHDHGGNVDDEIRFATAAVALRPDSPGARFHLGAAFAKKGALDQAITEYREAIRIQKEYPFAHCEPRRCLARQGSSWRRRSPNTARPSAYLRRRAPEGLPQPLLEARPSPAQEGGPGRGHCRLPGGPTAQGG